MESVKFFKIIIYFALASCYVNTEFSGTSLSLGYYTQIQTDGHFVTSPFGVWSLTAAVALGAHGDSRTQLAAAFSLPQNQDEIINAYTNLITNTVVLDPSNTGVSLMNQNFIFLDNEINLFDDFRRTLTTYFGAIIENLDFQDSTSAAQTANTIIENSGASVSNVLESSDFTESTMILTNVISFKGLWSSPFDISETKLEPFYDENGNEIGQVNMMFQSSPLLYSNMKDIEAFVLQLSYGRDGKYCMLVILPYANVKVTELFSNLATVSFNDIFTQIDNDVEQFGLDDVDVKLPRFKISTNLLLNKPLNDMGVYDIFDASKANFQGMTTKEIYVSSIVHKADIEVTESGTVASASTSAQFKNRMSSPRFYANRPFIYFIMERSTATVIFEGIYSKPSIF